MTVGIRITSLRKGKKLSQASLAKQLNISQSTLAMYEKDKRTPSPKVLEKIASYFNVTTDFILGRDEDKTPQKHTEIDDIVYYNGKEIPEKYKRLIKELMDMDD